MATAATLLFLLWLDAGAPWPPPLAALTAAGVTRLLQPAVPGRWRRPIGVGALAGTAVLLADVSYWAWLLLGAFALVAVLGGTDRPDGSPVDRARAETEPLVTLTAAVLTLAGLLGLVVEQVTGAGQRPSRSASPAANRAPLLPPSPARTVHDLLDAVADNDPTACRTLLTPAAADQLAATTGTPDCPTAIQALFVRVVDRQHYPAPDPNSLPVTLTFGARTSTVDACHLAWPGFTRTVRRTGDHTSAVGPQLGHLDLTRGGAQGYRITRVRPCAPDGRP
jgi:hypothetical protein